MKREGLLAECTELATVAGPSVSIVRALDLLGDTARAQSWAHEVAILEGDILSEMLRDGLQSDVVTERFARVLYVKGLAGDRPALRRYEQALRQFWQQTLRSKSGADAKLQGTAQNLLVCAILLDKRDLALEASEYLPDGPWQDLGRAWANDDRTLLAALEKRLAVDIASDESSGDLSILSDGWSYLILEKVRRVRDDADGARKGLPHGR